MDIQEEAAKAAASFCWIKDPIKPPAMQVCSQRALALRRKPPEV